MRYCRQIGVIILYNKIKTLEQLYERRLCLVKQLKDITLKMTDCPIEEIQPAINKRDEAFAAIKALDNEIAGFCNKDKAIADMLNSCRLPCENIPPELFRLNNIFDAIAADIKELKKTEPKIRLRLECELDHIKAKIQESNIAGQSVAEKYHKAVQLVSSGNRISENNKFI